MVFMTAVAAITFSCLFFSLCFFFFLRSGLPSSLSLLLEELEEDLRLCPEDLSRLDSRFTVALPIWLDR